jgi:prevent-host-death family protein
LGDALVIDPRHGEMREVSVRELSRNTSEVLRHVKAGGRALVTKHGAPVAVLLELEEALGAFGSMPLRRREAERRLFGDALDAELRRRDFSRAPRLLGGD